MEYSRCETESNDFAKSKSQENRYFFCRPPSASRIIISWITKGEDIPRLLFWISFFFKSRFLANTIKRPSDYFYLPVMD